MVHKRSAGNFKTISFNVPNYLDALFSGRDNSVGVTGGNVGNVGNAAGDPVNASPANRRLYLTEEETKAARES